MTYLCLFCLYTVKRKIKLWAHRNRISKIFKIGLTSFCLITADIINKSSPKYRPYEKKTIRHKNTAFWIIKKTCLVTLQCIRVYMYLHWVPPFCYLSSFHKMTQHFMPYILQLLQPKAATFDIAIKKCTEDHGILFFFNTKPA